MLISELVWILENCITVMDSVLRKMTNTIATNVMSNASMNRHSKKVRDCYILLTVLLVIILLLIIIIIICHYYAKRNGINALTI